MNDDYVECGKIIDDIIHNRKDKNMNETKTVKSGGIGFCGLLAIVFIALKLAGIGAVASWSWLWVLSPLWIPAVAVILFVIIAMIILALAAR